MTSRIFGFFLFTLAVAIALFAATTSTVNAQDDRAADREAIRAHIDSIFQAFIKKDAAALESSGARLLRDFMLFCGCM